MLRFHDVSDGHLIRPAARLVKRGDPSEGAEGRSGGWMQLVQDVLEGVDAGARGDPFGGAHGPQREAAPGAGAMLQQDLVAAGVEAHRMVAHDAACAQRRHMEGFVRQGAVQGRSLTPPAAAGRRRGSTRAARRFPRARRACGGGAARARRGRSRGRRRKRGRLAHHTAEELHADGEVRRRRRGRRPQPRRAGAPPSVRSCQPSCRRRSERPAPTAAATLAGTASARVKSMPTGQSRGNGVPRPTISGSCPASRSAASTSRPIAPCPTTATFTASRPLPRRAGPHISPAHASARR